MNGLPRARDKRAWVQFEGPEIGCTGTRFFHADPRGSIVALADCWGNNQAINSYDEFGIPDTATGNDIATKGRFRYTGQAWIPELGMYYYKARIYSPTLGRFQPRGGFATPGRRGSPSWACTTTRPASTRPPSGGSQPLCLCRE
ncbi:MAG: hypothetical protein MUF47_14325 [Porphyrobacter sp.]|nr:hypothetical protein [Porphyrobacter sp.]